MATINVVNHQRCVNSGRLSAGKGKEKKEKTEKKEKKKEKKEKKKEKKTQPGQGRRQQRLAQPDDVEQEVLHTPRSQLWVMAAEFHDSGNLEDAERLYQGVAATDPARRVSI